MPEDIYFLGVRDMNLTPTEEAILRYVCQGYSNLRIAISRGVSQSAVERVLTRLRKKINIVDLGCPARIELVNIIWLTAWKNADKKEGILV